MRLLLSNPMQECLQFRRGLERGHIAVGFLKLPIGIGRVELLVAGFAERDAVFRAAAARFGFQVVQRDEVWRNVPSTKLARRVTGIWGYHQRSLGREGRESPKKSAGPERKLPGRSMSRRGMDGGSSA